MSFGEHLEELRRTLWKSLIALALGSIVGFAFGQHVVRFIQTPLQEGLEKFRVRQAVQLAGEDAIESNSEIYIPQKLFIGPERWEGIFGQPPDVPDNGAGLYPLTVYLPVSEDLRVQPIGTGIPDAFVVYVKAALLVGAIVSSPAVFYFLWDFVASGLYAHERKYVYVFMPFSLGLFLLGASVAFFFAVTLVVDFLFGFYEWLGIMPTPRINEWLGFILLLPLGFGVAFQLPLVMLFLERIGVFPIATYRSYWRIAILVIFVLSMLLTPSDPGSMLLLAIPLTGLYFGGILLCQFMPRRKTPFGDEIG